MTRPALERTKKALKLLDTFHPKYPNRRYTVFEACAKTGTPMANIYYHLKKQRDAAAALAAQQSEGE